MKKTATFSSTNVDERERRSVLTPLVGVRCRKILVILFCLMTGLMVANPAWAHGGGGGGGGNGGGGNGGGGNGGGGGGSHGGGEGHGGGMGHGAGLGLGHADADDASSTYGEFAGHKGAGHHGRGLSAHSRSSHLTATHHSLAHPRSLAHHHIVSSFKGARQVSVNKALPGKRAVTPDVVTEKALPPGSELNVDRGKAVPPGIQSKVGVATPDVDTPAEKALPPGIELNVDRGKALPPGIRSKFGTVTPDVDTAAEKALPPGQELNVDRGKVAAPGTVTPDNESEHMEPASDDSARQ
jgi:hypothetical protein